MSASSPPLAEALRVAATAWSLLREGASLERALAAALPQAAAPRLRAAAQDLLYAATRRLAWVEALIDRLAQRPPERPVRALLAIALTQLDAGGRTDFTVVDQAVRAAKGDASTAGAAGFVNALLRRYLRERATLDTELRRDAVVRTNLPSWWLARLQADHPQDWERIAALQLLHPPMVLRVNRRRATPHQMLARWAEAGIAARAVGEDALCLAQPLPVGEVPGFAEGWVSVQDAGSQLAAPFLQAMEGMRVLDACAAPGGKTAHLLERAQLELTALEVDGARARRIHENLARLGLAAEVRVADAGELAAWWDGRPYQRILLDAPCTASGIVRRHPDIPWLRREADVAQLARGQSRLLDALWEALAPAGRLLYVVCSLFPQEGAQQVDRFLDRRADARLVPLATGLPGRLQLLPAEAPEPAAPGLPAVHDAFFYALLEKIP
ncbi:MAG: ribosomal small subunit methyltransferase [Pseudomonadota bacterium]